MASVTAATAATTCTGAPMFHMFGFSAFVLGTPAMGATAVLVPGRFSVERLMVEMEEHGVTRLLAGDCMAEIFARAWASAAAADGEPIHSTLRLSAGRTIAPFIFVLSNRCSSRLIPQERIANLSGRTGPRPSLAGSVPASCQPPSGHAPDYGSADMPLSIAVCKRIAQMINGNMWWAASESEGLGETMTLLLRFQLQPPLNPHVPGSGGGTYRIGASPRTLPQHHHFNGLRILLADSDTTSIEVTRKLLERLGCEVVPAASAADCLSFLGGGGAEPPFQLVVLDIDARGAAATMDGFEVALRIRELSNACWLLVLVAVAASGVDDRVRDMCRRAGVNGLIEKPVTQQLIQRKLSTTTAVD
ncbi:unnamed protein product [Urochloa humidicola]